MPRLAVTLALAVLSLAFAPAPFPRAERPKRQTQQQAMGECVRRLNELNVRWELSLDHGRGRVDFAVRGRGYAGACWFRDDELLAALRDVIEMVERFYKQT
jgi:hypothetical protein